MAAPMRKAFVLKSCMCHCASRSFNLSYFNRSLSTHSQKLLKSEDNSQRNHVHVEGQKTHFGFQSVPEEEKEHKVYEVFENVASKYDLMNDAMSGGIHRIWKDIFLDRFAPAPGTKLLDVAGGTGDIAFRFLKYVGTPTHISLQNEIAVQESSEETSSSEDEILNAGKKFSSEPDANGSHVTVCDINQAMLDVGRHKAQEMGYTSGISWLRGNAEKLDLPDNTFDAYTIAFGIRNCTHVQKVINEAYRVLKPGGRFLCLEFSEVKNSLLRSVYDTYSFQVIPVMGQVLAGDWKSYQYLVESIRQFPNQEDFAAMIKLAGFRMVSYENLTFGVAAIHSGFKI